jgi:hypothetical protein
MNAHARIGFPSQQPWPLSATELTSVQRWWRDVLRDSECTEMQTSDDTESASSDALPPVEYPE